MTRVGVGLMLGLAGVMAGMAEAGVLVEVPGLWAGFAAGPAARVTGNFSHADLNDDGRADLLLEREAWIRGAGPGWTRKIPLPGGAETDAYDVDREGVLWVISGNRLSGWRLAAAEDGWEPATDEVSVDEPVTGREPALDFGCARRRFLYDLDGDDQDDLVTVTPRGVCWHRRQGAGFDAAGRVLTPLPEPQAVYTARGTLWPPGQRALCLPGFRFSAEVSVGADAILLVHGEESAAGMRWTTLRYPIFREGHSVKTGEGTRDTGPPLPPDAVPVWLDRDAGRPGFARVYREPDSSGIPGEAFAVCEVWEPGETSSRVFRRPAPSGAALYPPLADINRDGRLDVVLMTVGLARRGPRERAQELLTGNRLQVEVSVWFRQAGGYPREPSWQDNRTVYLDAPPIRQPRMLEAAARGQLASLHGDFNGDGRADLLLRERLDQVACYLCDEGGCARQPVFTVEVSPGEAVVPADINGDGLADVVRVPEPGGGPARVYLTEGNPQ